MVLYIIKNEERELDIISFGLVCGYYRVFSGLIDWYEDLYNYVKEVFFFLLCCKVGW